VLTRYPAPVDPGSDERRPPATKLSIVEIARLVAAGQLSAQEIVSAHLQQIAARDSEINALVYVDGERALDTARRIDRRRSRGQPLGLLAGVPYAVKDNIDVRGQVTAAGSRAGSGVRARRHAAAVSRLRAADGVLLARANTDELSMGATTQTSAFGATRNPWDLRRSPGGSSGGSAAAVAAGMAAFSLGTDTGGSIREPASQCGVVGLAPSPGAVPLHGVISFAPDLDRVGPFARSISDTALLIAILAGRPELAQPRPDRARALRVGLVKEHCGSQNEAGVLSRLDAACDVLRQLGVELANVSIPDAPRALADYMAITSAACVALFERYVRSGRAGEEVLRRWNLGRALRGTRASVLTEAHKVQRRLVAQTREALGDCDVMLSPSMPTTAPLLITAADHTAISITELADPTIEPDTECWTVLANLTGLPALSLPAGRVEEDGMPVGVMLTARPDAEADLLDLAELLEADLSGSRPDTALGQTPG
jgi:aspartyl-tRNA(Asn)/glutamyl-tRNA(Gln) amidotransferase subunit A